MKKSVIALAIAGTLAPVFAQAQSNVTLYGRVNEEFVRQKIDGSRGGWALRDSTSRWGFKGTEDLGSGMKARFGVEQAFQADSGGSTTAANTGFSAQLRNAYVGLDTSIGSVRFGRLDSGSGDMGAPLYAQFVAAVSHINHDTGVTNIGQLTTNNRQSNAAFYQTPNFGGFTVSGRAAFTPADAVENVQTGSTASGNVYEQDIRAYQLAGQYAKGGLYVGTGFETRTLRDSSAANLYKRHYQLTGAYNFGFLKLTGWYGRDGYKNEAAGTRKHANQWLLGVSAPFGNHEVIANYIDAQLQSGTSARTKRFQVGYGYNLSKRTRTYAYYDLLDPNTTVSSDKRKALGFGLRHNF